MKPAVCSIYLSIPPVADITVLNPSPTFGYAGPCTLKNLMRKYTFNF